MKFFQLFITQNGGDEQNRVGTPFDGFEDLPLKARAYVERLVSLIGGRLGILSVGPERETTLRMGL